MNKESSSPEMQNGPNMAKWEVEGDPTGANGMAPSQRKSISSSPLKRTAVNSFSEAGKIRRTNADSAPAQRRAIPVQQNQGAGEFRSTSSTPISLLKNGGPLIPPLSIPRNTAALPRPITNMHGLSPQSPFTAQNSSAPTTPFTTMGAQKFQVPVDHPEFFSKPQPAHPNPTAHTSPPYQWGDVECIVPEFGDSGGYSQFVPMFRDSGDYIAGMAGGQLDMSMGHVSGQTRFEGFNPPFQRGVYNMDVPGQNPPSQQQTLNTHPAKIGTIAPQSPPRESLLSEDKWQKLIFLIDSFSEVSTLFPRGILSGPAGGDERHPLSLNMMQNYIHLYWVNFHPQLPIMHKPTFSAEKTPGLLLLCVLIIGAACMDFKQDPTLGAEAADLAKIISRSLRWAIFVTDEFRLPAKLWVLQALLLLETYEKMYSDSTLHQRAHIHHMTTLVLVKHGMTTAGAYDSPQSGRDAKSTSDSAIFGSQTGITSDDTSDEAWNRWIVQEATKRVAFAAFVMDSTHATMFGHSAVLAASEMRLQLPCDETLWSATSASEVFSIQQSLNNAHTPTFSESLKKTLQGQIVATNSFGRTILMAGLLSMVWHSHRRERLGVGRGEPRSKFTASFDHWDKGSCKDTFFESRTVLYCLAHMSMQVDISDLQIYAGAHSLLGHKITKNYYGKVRERIKSWAPTEHARDAVFYALRFLSQVLLPEEHVEMQYNTDKPDTPGSCATNSITGVPVYSARDDHLLNRPWVLYYACIMVWSYGFALEGPLPKPIQMPCGPAESYAAMRTFLRKADDLQAPEGLTTLQNKNACLGLLLTLKMMFAQCRWELLVEASKLLGRCVRISTGELSVATHMHEPVPNHHPVGCIGLVTSTGYVQVR